MSLADVRLAMMQKFTTISGVHVPQDPLPKTIDDKTIVVFPAIESSELIAKGHNNSSLSIQAEDSMQVEYHRRVPYEHLGSTIGDVTAMVDTIRDLCWRELAGGKFSGTILIIRGVSLEHLGALGWNEWTFGARMKVSFSHLIEVTS